MRFVTTPEYSISRCLASVLSPISLNSVTTIWGQPQFRMFCTPASDRQSHGSKLKNSGGNMFSAIKPETSIKNSAIRVIDHGISTAGQ